MRKYIIEFPRDIKANQPIEIEAESTLQAYCSLGATVWTEEAYEEMLKRLDTAGRDT